MCVQQCVVSIASGTQCCAHSYPKRATHWRGEQPVYSSGAHCISTRMRIFELAPLVRPEENDGVT